MRPNDLLLVLAALIAACASSNEKSFDQMTAREHREAAAREHELAADSFEKITGENIEPDVYYGGGELGGYIYYDPYYYELGDPETYVGWPRVHDPSENYEDAAREHQEKALRHERAAALLEGRPSPQPLPPPHPPLLPPDQT